MHNYLQIINKIKQTPWLITPEGLSVILAIVETRLNEGRLSDEEIRTRLSLIDPDGHDQPSADAPDGIGILSLYGPIFGKANLLTELSGATSLETFSKQFNEMLVDDSIHSIVLDIDSPGGTSDLVRETGALIAGADKPVYALANTEIGSAAYWLASQAKHLYATASGMVGSIGVYTVHQDQSGHDQQQGYKFTYISAGPNKTEGNPHEPLSKEGEAYRQEIVDELYVEFVDAVASGRGVSAEVVKSDFGGGRMYTAKKACEVGMADGITTFDSLIEKISADNEKPRTVSVLLPGVQIAAANIVGNVIDLTSIGTAATAADATGNVVIQLESKEMEHSEPGSGQGGEPAPRTDEDGSDDKAIVNKWRRNPLPLDPNDPAAPKANSNKGDVMTPEQEAELRELLKLDADGDLVAAVNQLVAEVTPLREAVAASSEEANLASQFPTFYRQHQALVERDNFNAAVAFVDSVKWVTKPEGGKTNFSLSTLAAETLRDIHIKFTAGTGNISDFTQAIQAIMHSGIVEMGERGSSLNNNNAELDVDLNNMQQSRKVFGDKVVELMKNDNLTVQAATQEAARLYPELARAYAVAGMDKVES